MSYFDYVASRDIEQRDYPFYALVMALMRKADDKNLKKLCEAWPDVWRELEARYHSPGGKLLNEVGY